MILPYKLLINCTAHQLTDEQKREHDGFLNLREEFPKTYEQLIQCPDTAEALESLALQLIGDLILLAANSLNNGWEKVDILFPIGSPAFQFAFYRAWKHVDFMESMKKMDIIFSHSIRESVENPETGEKRSIFKHQKFIKF